MQKIRLYKSPLLRAVAVILCIMLAALIFSMSAEVAGDSASRSGKITEKVVKIVVSDFEKLEKPKQVKLLSDFDHAIRKTAHFCVYATLGALVCFASVGYMASYRMHFGRSLAICVLYAASDELHQYFVPGRGPGVSDVLLDGVGSACGIAVILIFAGIVLKRLSVAYGGKYGT